MPTMFVKKSIKMHSVACQLRKKKDHLAFLGLNLAHTYIIGHYNPSVRIIDLVSHTTYVVCGNFIHKWRDLQFKVDTDLQNFWQTFHGKFINTQCFCKKSAERIFSKKSLFSILFWCLACCSNPGFTTNKSTNTLPTRPKLLQ